tara:strand:+ start:929 stop:1279 length:351 start_codon:yes stop_codon:yes gene_type:complete
MRIHTKDKDLRDYKIGETIQVDVSYQSSTYKAPAKFVEGVVLTDWTQPLKVMVGSGDKVHDARGLMVRIDDEGKNWNGTHEFGIRPKCQQYRGRGLNCWSVSTARVVDLPTTCSKC